MEAPVHAPRLVQFGTYEVDLPARELRKDGVKLKLTGQPFQVLTILLESKAILLARSLSRNRSLLKPVPQ
jgi:DNA-binding response OmpR family regulator